MTISDVTSGFFSIFSSLWTFISGSPILAFALFAPLVLTSIILIIKAFK